jgi:hypothetical protein
MATIQELRRRLKYGPKFESRETRTEFALAQAGLPPRKIGPEVIQKIRTEVERLSRGDRPAHVRAFAAQMLERYPELGNKADISTTPDGALGSSNPGLGA